MIHRSPGVLSERNTHANEIVPMLQGIVYLQVSVVVNKSVMYSAGPDVESLISPAAQVLHTVPLRPPSSCEIRHGSPAKPSASRRHRSTDFSPSQSSSQNP